MRDGWRGEGGVEEAEDGEYVDVGEEYVGLLVFCSLATVYHEVQTGEEHNFLRTLCGHLWHTNMAIQEEVAVLMQ